MEKITISKHRQELFETAKKIKEEALNEVMAAALFVKVSKEEKILAIFPEIEDTHTKRMLTFAKIGMSLKKDNLGDIEEAYFVTEAWFLKGDKEKYKKTGQFEAAKDMLEGYSSIKEHPNAREAIIGIYRDSKNNFNSDALMFKVVDDKVIWESIDDEDTSNQMSAGWDGLLTYLFHPELLNKGNMSMN